MVVSSFRGNTRRHELTILLEEFFDEFNTAVGGTGKDVAFCAARQQPIDDSLITVSRRLEEHASVGLGAFPDQKIDDLGVTFMLGHSVVVLHSHRQKRLKFQWRAGIDAVEHFEVACLDRRSQLISLPWFVVQPAIDARAAATCRCPPVTAILASIERVKWQPGLAGSAFLQII